MEITKRMMTITEKYQENRHLISKGDIVLFIGSSFLSKSIQYFDRLPHEKKGTIFNHALVVGEMDNRLMAVESIAKGVHPDFLSQRVSQNVDFMVFKPISFSQKKIDEAFSEMFEQAEEGIKYDKMLLLRIAACRKLGIEWKKQDDGKDICSETAARRYATVGLGAHSFREIIMRQGWITPMDIYRYYDPTEFKVTVALNL